jgi:hypothetical protein
MGRWLSCCTGGRRTCTIMMRGAAASQRGVSRAGARLRGPADRFWIDAPQWAQAHQAPMCGISGCDGDPERGPGWL